MAKGKSNSDAEKRIDRKIQRKVARYKRHMKSKKASRDFGRQSEFAALAMQAIVSGLIAAGNTTYSAQEIEPSVCEALASKSFKIAAAMLAEEKKIRKQ